MAIVQEIRCDMCGRVLVGSKGVVKISHSYIEIAGFVRDWIADPQTGWREFTFISAPDKRQMAFCTELEDGTIATCLFDYVQFKRDSARVRREAQLREEAGEEFMMRNGATGPTGTRRGAPPPSAPPHH